MKPRIIIAAPKGQTRKKLYTFFASRAELFRLERETMVAQQRLVITDDSVIWDGQDISVNIMAAIVTDSGYMWPLPTLDPTQDEWQEYAGRFDDYLRNERESTSLWYSLLEILADYLPVCVNSPAAFSHGALKISATEILAQKGVPLPPQITTNDPKSLSAFADAQNGKLWVSQEGKRPQWLEQRQLERLDLQASYVTVQALSSKEMVSVIAVNGQAVASSCDQALCKTIIKQLGTIQEALEMPWATLIFRPGQSGYCLSDFSPSPVLDELSDAELEKSLETLWVYLKRRSMEKASEKGSI